MEIKPLSSETLEEVVTLARSNFQHEAPETAPETAFRASLDKERYKEFYDKNNIKSLEYWVGVKDQQVIGTVDLFTLYEDAEEAAWLGWFCVHPEYKGKGIGKKQSEIAISSFSPKLKIRMRTACTPREVLLTLIKKMKERMLPFTNNWF